MKTQKITTKEKASFYISKDLVKRMKPFLVKTKKTDFINQSIEKNLDALEKEKAKKELLKIIDEIKPVKTKKSSLQMLHEVREERLSRIIKNNK